MNGCVIKKKEEKKVAELKVSKHACYIMLPYVFVVVSISGCT